MLGRRVSMILAASGLVAAAAGACSSADEAGPGGGAASGAGAGGSGGGTQAGLGTGGGGGAEPLALGRACTADPDCGGGSYWCLQATANEPLLGELFRFDIEGGPAGGYCTKTCTAANQCPGTGSICQNKGEESGLCLLGCTLGDPELTSIWDPIPDSKCQGRDDLMCVPLQGGGAACVPVCGSADECPGGGTRGCDLAVGLCRDVTPTGDPFGGPCTTDNPATSENEDTCAGRCIKLVSGEQEYAVCSGLCSVGGESVGDENVNGSRNCGGLLQGLCMIQGVTDGEPPIYSGMGDYGFCGAACKQHDSCYYEVGFFCFDLAGLFGDQDAAYCSLALPCPLGTECAENEACAATASGPVCLETNGGAGLLFELGEAGPGGRGGGSSGGSGGSGGSEDLGGAGGW